MKSKNNYTIELSKKVNKKKIYINEKKATKLKKAITKDLEYSSELLDDIESILSKLSYKKMLTDESNGIALSSAKRCSILTKSSTRLANSLETKFFEDTKSAVLNELDERISFLEKRFKDIR